MYVLHVCISLPLLSLTGIVLGQEFHHFRAVEERGVVQRIHVRPVAAHVCVRPLYDGGERRSQWRSKKEKYIAMALLTPAHMPGNTQQRFVATYQTLLGTNCKFF